MTFYNRKPTRIPQYDYSASNYYFITVCTHNRKCIFGNPGQLNKWGNIVKKHILQIDLHYEYVKIDHFVVMPNHIHLILVLGCNGTENANPDAEQVIAQLKSGISREIHCSSPEIKIWQRSFHDHIIRNQQEYEKIWFYIETNPQRWEKDCFYIDQKL